MPINSKDTWKCDLCGKPITVEKNTTPKGWVKFETESRYVDREFHEHIICDGCTTDIVRAAKA